MECPFQDVDLPMQQNKRFKTLRSFLRSIVLIPKNVFDKIRLKLKISKSTGKLQIIIGSEKTKYKNWLPTNIQSLNLLKMKSFVSLFDDKKVDRFLAEHVFEHITYEDALIALRHCNIFLKEGGVIRIAVPDGFHPNPEYIDMVKPGGFGYGSDDHKLLYNYKSLSKILEESGFVAHPLEYYDESGKFHFTDWNSEDGHVMRSMRYDKRFNESLGYSSLIVDGIKKQTF